MKVTKKKTLKRIAKEYQNSSDKKPKVLGNMCGGGGGGTTHKVMCSPGCEEK